MIRRKCVYLIGVALALLMVVMPYISKGYLKIPCSMVEVPPFTWEHLGESHADVLGLGYFILPLDCHHQRAVYSVSVAAYRIRGIFSATVL